MSEANPLMTKAAADAALSSDPRGRHVIGRTFAYFCVDPSFFGFAMWGTPDVADVRRLCRLMTCELSPAIPRHQSIVHFGAVDRVDADAFEVLRKYVEDHAARLSEQLARQAVVFGRGGMSSMVVAGFLQVFPPPYPASAFGSTDEAVRWLFPERPELALHVDALIQSAVAAPPVVTQLRSILEIDLTRATLEAAARAMACTTRTLQRRLREAGTTFQREYAVVQLAKAKQLLVETDAKIGAISLEVGFASASHFSAHFRKQTGMSPQAWRSEHG